MFVFISKIFFHDKVWVQSSRVLVVWWTRFKACYRWNFILLWAVWGFKFKGRGLDNNYISLNNEIILYDSEGRGRKKINVEMEAVYKTLKSPQTW